MANCIVRVELTQEIRSMYTLLRDSLIKVGFTKRIKDANGVEYRLPNGNYYIETTMSAAEVTKIVNAIASKIDKSPSVLVVIVAPKGMAWAGLQKC